jgi:hyperosmotically inducible periplasmic protein
MKYVYLALLLAVAFNSAPCSYANNTQVDNTAVNARDRNGYNSTAQDQSNEKPFVKTTARLRREIMRTKGLSVNAQNVKIIDENGCVTLRGPVDTEEEKSTLNNLAIKCCGQNVKDELEVKTP